MFCETAKTKQWIIQSLHDFWLLRSHLHWPGCISKIRTTRQKNRFYDKRTYKHHKTCGLPVLLKPLEMIFNPPHTKKNMNLKQSLTLPCISYPKYLKNRSKLASFLGTPRSWNHMKIDKHLHGNLQEGARDPSYKGSYNPKQTLFNHGCK